MQNGSMLNAFSPIVKAGHATGIIPFKYKICSKKSKTVLYIPTFSISVFILSLYIVTVTYTLILDDFRAFIGKGLPKIYLYIELASVYAGCASIGSMIFFRFRHMDNLAISFEYFNDIEELFKSLDCAIDYKRLNLRSMVIVLMQSVLYVSYLSVITYISDGFSSYARLPWIFVNFTPSYQIAIGRFICASFVHLIWLNLCQLNTAVEKLVHMTIARRTVDDYKRNKNIFNFRRFSNKFNDEEIVQKLDYILKTYAKICDCSIKLNEYYSGITFSIIFLSFLYTLFNTFSVMLCFIGIFAKGYDIPTSQVVLHLVRVAGNIVNLLVLIDMCNICEKEVHAYIYIQ